ncbi:MAG: MarR family winged helix-turn-helix transcriptional regulator [Solirubrobacteraceae bacterium]
MQTKRQAPSLASQLRIAVARTARTLRREAGGGLSPTSAAALATIDRNGSLTPSELATRERIQRPTATRLIANLEAAGLIERMADPADQRSCLLSLTPEGTETLHDIRTRKDAFLADRLKGLSAEDRATLRRAAELLEKLVDEA